MEFQGLKRDETRSLSVGRRIFWRGSLFLPRVASPRLVDLDQARYVAGRSGFFFLAAGTNSCVSGPSPVISAVRAGLKLFARDCPGVSSSRRPGAQAIIAQPATPPAFLKLHLLFT
jgi:hypothetical protein